MMLTSSASPTTTPPWPPPTKFTWGLDLSGQNGNAPPWPGGVSESPAGLHGAGGIGGLLAMTDTKGTFSEADDAYMIYFYDANGNVGQVIDARAGSAYFGQTAARYEYYPFGGNLLSAFARGTSGQKNPFMFSTKYRDIETGLYYSGERYLLPRLGRWVNRDPLQEQGGVNLYEALMNAPTIFVDPVGLEVRWFIDVRKDTGVRGAVGLTIQVDVKPLPCCRLIRWIQLVNEQRWRIGCSSSGWVVDSDNWDSISAHLCRARTPWYNLPGGLEGPEPMGPWTRWGMRDMPGKKPRDMMTQAISQDFETCAICVSGKGNSTTGCVLGCVKWGHFWSKGGSMWNNFWNPKDTTFDDHTFYYDKTPQPPSDRMKATLQKFMGLWNGFPIKSGC